MTKKISDILNFYYQNEIDEVYLEKSINNFAVKPLKNLASEQVKQSNKIIDHVNKKPKITNEIAMKTIKETSPKNLEIANLPAQITSDQIASNSGKFLSLNEIILSAESQAKSAKNIDELKKIVENFDGCNLKKMATNTVFADGNVNSKIMVIGEAPGNQEDIEGIPFCGDSGELLDGILKSINLTRAKDFYITNAIYWRPPGNRRPTDEELSICRPFVEKHIELFAPKIIILVGSTAMNCLIKTNEPISSLRGKIIEFKPNYLPNGCKILTIFHPSFLMRQPSKKKLIWKDMINLKNYLAEIYEQ
jgi:uracil-DNA glycosylase family 4